MYVNFNREGFEEGILRKENFIDTLDIEYFYEWNMPFNSITKFFMDQFFILI